MATLGGTSVPANGESFQGKEGFRQNSDSDGKSSNQRDARSAPQLDVFEYFGTILQGDDIAVAIDPDDFFPWRGCNTHGCLILLVWASR